MEIQQVGVVGAGIMGAGIAQICSAAKLGVVMHDVEQRFLDRGMGVIQQNLERLVKKGELPAEEMRAALRRHVAATLDRPPDGQGAAG